MEGGGSSLGWIDVIAGAISVIMSAIVYLVVILVARYYDRKYPPTPEIDEQEE